MSTNSFADKVVVIGGGLAGLTTAYRLHQLGLDVHVYEARNRVGGRILSVKIDNHIAELGAQNITDGGDATNLLNLIQELGLKLSSQKLSTKHIYFDGKTEIDLDQLLQQRKLNFDFLESQLQELSKRSLSMQDVLQGLFDKEDVLYKIFAIRLATYEGAPVEQLSSFYVKTLSSMLSYNVIAVSVNEDQTFDFLSLSEGNSLLPEKMAQALGPNIHLNKILKSVSKDNSGSFSLTFHDGATTQADKLVLACPCSVYEQIEFQSNVIPEERLKAIRNIKYGKNSKILAPFSQASKKLKGFVFNERMISFIGHPNLLTMYYTGSPCHFYPNTMVKNYHEDKVMIKKGYGDCSISSQEPVHAEDKPFVRYIQPVAYSWIDDPFAKGSYSYIAHDQRELLTSMSEVGSEKVKTLFAPIENLYFAGEHASILMDTPGTMEAACESGERTARLIKNSLK